MSETVRSTNSTFQSGTTLLNDTASITNKADTIINRVVDEFSSYVSTGDYLLQTLTGNVMIDSNNSSATAIQFDSSTNNGGILIKSGTQGLNLDTTGQLQLNSSGDINIGDSSDTSNIYLNSSTNINLSSSDISLIASDDVSITSTSGGNIIFDVNGNNVSNAMKIFNDGNILVNKDSTTNDYQMEINVATSSTEHGNNNGLIIESTTNTITPDLKIKYQKSDGSKTVINSIGTYSETNTDSRYREYVGYQFGNQIIAIEGPEFQNNDIGKQIYFNQGETTANITGLGKIILPADNNNISNSSNTLVAGGLYTGNTSIIIKVEIDSTNGSVDTFRWSKDGGKTYEATFVLCSFAYGQKYPLTDGIYIKFTNKTGHTLEDFWTIQAKITAVVDTDNIITGSVTRDTSTSETVVTSITNNSPVTTTSSTLAGTVFSNITSNIALSGIQTITTNAPFQGFLGTTTNSDLIFKTANEERFKITADGSLGVSKDNIDGRLHLTSNFNKEIMVNDNIIVSGTVTETTNLGDNIIRAQQNSVSCELQTGGYVVAYESFEAYDTDANADEKYNIYANYFSGNGEKIGSSFKVNITSTLHQFAPHIAKSGTKSSDNYIKVWVHQTSTGSPGEYQIRGQIFTSNNQKISSSANSSGTADIVISDTTSDNIYMAPRVVGLSNGNYVVVFTSLEGSYYQIKYVILNSTGTEVTTGETLVTSGSNNYIYPYVGALSASDSSTTYAGGFVVTYMKQVNTSDNRYQLLFKVYNNDATTNSGEQTISDAGISNGDDVAGASDFAMTDGLAYVEGLSDTEAKTNGGFLISYQTNYSGNVDYNNVADVSRSVTGVSSSATGNIIASGITINGTTGVQTWVITSVVGSFLKGEIVYVVGTDGTYAEKIDTIITDTSASTATITLSKDPKNIVVQRYQSSDFTAAWTANGNTTNLVIDKNKELLKENSTTPWKAFLVQMMLLTMLLEIYLLLKVMKAQKQWWYGKIKEYLIFIIKE